MARKKKKARRRIPAPVIVGVLIVGAIGSLFSGGEDEAGAETDPANTPSSFAYSDREHGAGRTFDDLTDEPEESGTGAEDSAPEASPPEESAEPSEEPPQESAPPPSENPTQSAAPMQSSAPVQSKEPERTPDPEQSPEPEQTPEPEQPPAQTIDPEQAFREKLAQYNYVGSIESDKYHYPSCQHTGQINDENLVHFDTVEEAQAAGYSPCGTCHPK